MTTIPNLNIVIQQGQKALDSQHIRQQATDLSQIAASDQNDRDIEQQSTVQESEQTDNIRPDNEKERESREQNNKKKKKKKDLAKAKKASATTGVLLDTIA